MKIHKYNLTANQIDEAFNFKRRFNKVSKLHDRQSKLAKQQMGLVRVIDEVQLLKELKSSESWAKHEDT